MSIFNITDTNYDFQNFDIDKLLDFKEKGRKINPYYGIYKINMFRTISPIIITIPIYMI